MWAIPTGTSSALKKKSGKESQYMVSHPELGSDPPIEFDRESGRDTWRLNEEVMLAVLNEDLLLLEFDSPKKAKWVLESGRRSFKGGVLQLDWWSPESGCIRCKDLVQEAWIRVVGLPLHLWTPEILRKLGDACGGFVALDKDTEMKTKVKWARILIKSAGKSRSSIVNILEGQRSFELQI